MAADDYNPVSSNGTMSRRRISVKELGQPDHQGWLYRKKESKGFLGMKWKKFWFVLKKTALYWYTNQLAEKAEGYIDLTNFMVDRAIECKKKYAFKACHPQVMMFYFAVMNFCFLCVSLHKHGCSECYSEASDHEEAETTEIPPPPYSEQTLRDSVDAPGPPGSTHQGTLPPPYSSAAPSEANGSLSSPVSTMTSQSSASSLTKQRQSWLDLVSHASPAAAGETAVVCSAQVHLHQCPQEETAEAARLATRDSSETGSNEEVASAEGEEQRGHENSSDEMEKLYIHLKEASLSPIGERKPSTKKEFRTSFIRRCKNQAVNDKLHLIRALNSTLKAKESDLQAIEQILSDRELTSHKFREWKEANVPLVQEICVKQDQQVASEAAKAEASVVAAPVVETSL
uniref:Interaction protein for cytohesin exchange factors 1 n=1 Tax=Amphilophus citrinellus TaxID=61819 RepID=A0A3Q0SDN4_AMPCI